MKVRSKKKVTSERVKGMGEALAGGRNRCLKNSRNRWMMIIDVIGEWGETEEQGGKERGRR